MSDDENSGLAHSEAVLGRVSGYCLSCDKETLTLEGTRQSWWERHGSSIVGAVEAITNNWIIKRLGLPAVVVSILAGIATFVLAG
jgi:hypothetical protein